MPNITIARRRLQASGLSGTRFASPEAVVGWFGAVQSQDYGGAAWGIGQRLGPGATVGDVDAALADGRILRTHAMRPTWHFLLPADIRWILALTSHRVHRLNAPYYRQQDLDAAALARAADILAQALEGGRHLTRPELGEALSQAGIPASGVRLAYVVSYAELEAVVCSGPRRGRQFTYALLDERAPAASAVAPVDREAALAELTRRYFTSHGPAQPRDFAWWSGLTIADAKAGLALAGDAVVRESIDGTEWWSVPPSGGEPDAGARDRCATGSRSIHLLPNYDEYVVSYRDHGPTFDAALLGQRWVGEVFAAHIVTRDGLAIGGWRREIMRDAVIVRPDLLVELGPEDAAAIGRAAEAYGRFLGLAARVEWGGGTPGDA